MPSGQRLDLLIEAMEAAVGGTGTLVIPAFSYSFTKGETFDIRNSPSMVGLVSDDSVHGRMFGELRIRSSVSPARDL